MSRRRSMFFFRRHRKASPNRPRRAAASKPNPSHHRLFEAYGSLSGEADVYLRTHLDRLLFTLGLVPHMPSMRVLEIGASTPFALTLMLVNRSPGAKIVLNDDTSTHPSSHRVFASHDPAYRDLTFEAYGFDAERHHWPVPDNAFDVVLFTEVLEHLLRNPVWPFAEAWRVLVPDGRFIVSTPNIAGLESVQALLDRRSPYTYGVYSRHGPEGRHNREYTPSEVEALGRATGFRTEVLTTRDCYETLSDTAAAARILAQVEDPNDQRGQVIFYIGRKTPRRSISYPTELFDFDPMHWQCDIELVEQQDGTARHRAYTVSLTNRGRLTWRTDEEDRFRIGVQLLASDGSLIARNFRRYPLPHDVSPGGRAVQTLVVDVPPSPRPLKLRFDLVHERVTWFGDVPGNSPIDIEIPEP